MFQLVRCIKGGGENWNKFWHKTSLHWWPYYGIACALILVVKGRLWEQPSYPRTVDFGCRCVARLVADCVTWQCSLSCRLIADPAGHQTEDFCAGNRFCVPIIWGRISDTTECSCDVALSGLQRCHGTSIENNASLPLVTWLVSPRLGAAVSDVLQHPYMLLWTLSVFMGIFKQNGSQISIYFPLSNESSRVGTVSPLSLITEAHITSETLCVKKIKTGQC
jgi:hypothetical protein